MGTLSHSFTDSSANVNLTSLGAEDYAIFRAGQSLANVYRKTGGGSLITIAEYDPNGAFAEDEETKSRTYTGTDATPAQGAETGNASRVANFGTTFAGGHEITLPAGLGVRTAKLYVMAYNTGATPVGNLFCHLSDSSAADINANFTGSSSSDNFVVVDLSWNANSASQTLQVRWTVTATAGAEVKATHWGATWVSAEAAVLPVINVQPTSQTVADGGTVSFTITVTSATSYQWQKLDPLGGTWANVSGGSGGTTDDYTTPTLSRSDTGSFYRLQATNANGTTTSDEVELTVTQIPTSYSGIGFITGASDSFTGEMMTGGPLSVSTVMDLTAATLSWSSKAIQNRQTTVHTAALLNQDSASVQNRLTTVHTAALLNQDSASVQNRQTTVHTAATMASWVPQAIQMRQIVELGAATWNWLAQEVEFVIGGAPVIFDLLAATFTKTAQSVQNRLTATLTAASQTFTGQSVQNRNTTPLTLGSLSFAAQNVQNRLTTVHTAAQITLTSLAVSARLSVSLTTRSMASWLAKAVQMTQTAVHTSALLKFLTQDVTITTNAVVEAFRRGLLRLSRYRKLLKQRRY